MKLYLIRHGETEWNKKRLMQGNKDIPLAERGRELAKVTGEALKDVPFDLAFTSPLSRAKETAQYIIGDRKIPLIEDARIREISFGIFEGLCCTRDENYNIPDPEFIKFFDDPAAYRAPEGGETLIELCQRTTEFLRELAANPEYQDKTILVSSHGCAVKGLLSSISMGEMSNFWNGGVHKNCGVTILNEKDGIFEIEVENKIYYQE